MMLLCLLLSAQDPAWGRIEWKENAVRLIVQTWPADGKLAMPRLNNPIGAVYLEGDAAKTALKFEPNVADWTVHRPANREGNVVVIETVGKPRRAGEPVVTDPAADGSITLAAHDAVTHGRLLRYEPQPHKNTVGYWADEKDWCEWTFRVAKPGTYKVLLLQGCGKGQGGSEVKIVAGAASLAFTVEDTGHFQNFVERAAGTVKIEKAGPCTLEIRAVRKAKGAVMDVRQVRLVPAE